MGREEHCPREIAGDGSMEWVTGPVRASLLLEAADRMAELEAAIAKRDVLLKALWTRILAEHPQGGFPDMGMLEDELKWIGVI